MAQTMATPDNQDTQRSALSFVRAFLLTVLLIVWAIAPRWLQGLETIREAGVIDFNVNVWEVTTVLPAITIPIVLFYVFALTPPFRQYISGNAGTATSPFFVGGIGAVYGMSVVWYFLHPNWQIELILFPLILIGFLTSRRFGMRLGLLTTITLALYLFVDNRLLANYRQILPEVYQRQGVPEVLKFVSLEIYWVLLNAERIIFIWTGYISGLAVTWLGRRRFTPAIALLAGFIIAYLSLVIPTLGHQIPGIIVPHLIIQALAIGIGMAIAFLIVGSVQTTIAKSKAESAEIDRIEAELAALRAQINPHFFFNALNTIRYFVRSDPQKARRLLLDLSDIFQRILRSGDFVPLKDEIAHVEAYLNLEKARLGERLHYEKVVSDEALLETLVPTLILQPLVENAVVHGLAKKRSGGTIQLQLRPSGGDVIVEVSDDGVGISQKHLDDILGADSQAKSIGLRNVNKRLQALHGPDYRLSITSQPGEGTKVIVRLPLNGT